MTNQEKKHQHFVPQVYLRKFHHTKEIKGNKKKYFVSVYDKIENKPKKKIEVRDICAKKKLYTLDSPHIKIRESIENFYSKTLEKDYNNLYDILIDPKRDTISLQQRELIITTIANLHLRNYFWLKKFNDFWESLIDRYPAGFNEKIYDDHGNVLFDFSTNDKNQIISKDKQKNKQLFIKSHLEHTIKWTKLHFHDIIVIDFAPDNSRYITSDRPVICIKISDPLRMPIDSKHMITLLSPPTKQDINDEKLYRKVDLINPDITNLMQYENAERFVIGYDLNNIEKAKMNYEKATKR